MAFWQSLGGLAMADVSFFMGYITQQERYLQIEGL